MKELQGLMNPLLEPSGAVDRRSLRLWAVALLVLSAMSMLIAAESMPPPYSWRVHSISESAAQGLQHAWIARMGFLFFGSAVLLLSLARRGSWPRIAYWMHLVFSACMFATAAFSHKPWVVGLPFDAFEDLLHSIAASTMGFAFSAGVIVAYAQRGRGKHASRALDVLALGLAVVVPIMLATSSSEGGAVQRLMFLVAYVWYGKEALMLENTRVQVS